MRQKDIRQLWKFTLRIAMYTGQENEDCIISYLHGYEDGTDNECHFIELLSDSVVTDYQLEPLSTNWTEQIKQAADKVNTDWVQVYKRQSLKVLVVQFDDATKKEFQDSFKKRIVGKVSGIHNHFRKDWIGDWFGLCDFSAVWFTEIWTQEELRLLRDIELELRTFGNVRFISDKIAPTDKLKRICEEFILELRDRDES